MGLLSRKGIEGKKLVFVKNWGFIRLEKNWLDLDIAMNGQILTKNNLAIWSHCDHAVAWMEAYVHSNFCNYFVYAILLIRSIHRSDVVYKKNLSAFRIFGYFNQSAATEMF